MRADEVATGRGAASARTRRGGTRAMAALAAEPAEAAMDLEEAAAETPSVFGNADRHPYAPVTATVGTAAMCATMRVSRVPRPYCTTTTAPYRSTLTFGKPHPGICNVPSLRVHGARMQRRGASYVTYVHAGASRWRRIGKWSVGVAGSQPKA